MGTFYKLSLSTHQLMFLRLFHQSAMIRRVTMSVLVVADSAVAALLSGEGGGGEDETEMRE